MSIKPSSSTWADDLSDDFDDNDTKKLLGNNVKSYQTTQQEIIQEHEEGLNKLGEAIKRQKHIAGELETEVAIHIEIIEDLDTGTTNVYDNLQKNTRNIKLVTKKSSTFCLWLLVVILAGVILALAV